MARAGACIAAALAVGLVPGGAATAIFGAFRIDVGTGAQLPSAGVAGFGPRYSPDGKEVLSWPNQDLLATDVVTQSSREIARAPQLIVAASWSPDGRTIAFWLNDTPVTGCPQPQKPPCGDAQIWLVGTDGSGLRKFSDDAVMPAWSPDSRRLAFLGNFDTHAQTGVVTIANADGTGRRVLSGREAGSGPEWSADGRFIAYTSTDLHGFHERVRILQLADEKRVQTLAASRFLAWSPRGSTLAYVHYLPGRTGLYLTDPATGQSRKLISSPRLSYAAWSPDGRSLAYPESPAACDVGPKIVVMPTSGGVERTLQVPTSTAHSHTSVVDLAWAADGHSIMGSTISNGLSCLG